MMRQQRSWVSMHSHQRPQTQSQGKLNLQGIESYPNGSVSKESTCNSGDTGAVGLILGWKYPLEKNMATYSSILLRKSHGQRSEAGYSPWSCKESDMTEQLNKTKQKVGQRRLSLLFTLFTLCQSFTEADLLQEVLIPCTKPLTSAQTSLKEG